MVGWCGRVEVQRGNRIAGLDGIGVGPATKAAPVADEELYRWLCMSLVRVQLLPSAENVQLSHESPRNCCLLQRPHGLCIAILMTSHTHTCTHTHTHTHMLTMLSFHSSGVVQATFMRTIFSWDGVYVLITLLL